MVTTGDRPRFSTCGLIAASIAVVLALARSASHLLMMHASMSTDGAWWIGVTDVLQLAGIACAVGGLLCSTVSGIREDWGTTNSLGVGLSALALVLLSAG